MILYKKLTLWMNFQLHVFHSTIKKFFRVSSTSKKWENVKQICIVKLFDYNFLTEHSMIASACIFQFRMSRKNWFCNTNATNILFFSSMSLVEMEKEQNSRGESIITVVKYARGIRMSVISSFSSFFQSFSRNLTKLPRKS